jgi:hypothetical protein
MVSKSELAMLPAESAKAIYLTMENLSATVQRQVDSLGSKMDTIEHGIDVIKEGMADGRVRFEKQDGDIRLVKTRVVDVERRVSAVESGVREAVRLPAKAEALSPKNADGTDRVEKDIRVKVVNALIIALAASIGGGLGAMIWSKIQSPPTVTVNATSSAAPTPPNHPAP